MKYIFLTEFFESSSLALWMKAVENQEVRVVVSDKNYKKILDGILNKEDNYTQFMGQKNIFITDDAESGPLADALRTRGELVFGGNRISDKMENDRSFGQRVMKEVGIATVKSVNFAGPQAFDKGIEFVKANKGRWVVKQNGNQDKSFSTVGKFDNGDDVIDKLKDFKHMWTEEIDFDLQEFVDGWEVAIEGWFNGKDWVKDKAGEPVFVVNWEHKKKSEGDTGRTTGETGTLSYRSHKNVGINKELTKLTAFLQKIGYIGNLDVNFMLSKKDFKFYGLEFTNRFGYPALNLSQEYFITPWHEFFSRSIKGENNFLEINPEWATVVVVQVPPFPFETSKDSNNAKGQRVYIKDKGKWSGQDTLTKGKLRHIHLYEVMREKESKHLLATGDTGYLLTVTAQGTSPKASNDTALQFIKDTIESSNMDYRKDIGINDRVKESIELMYQRKLL